MTTRRPGKVGRPRLVAVIASPADLEAAIKLRDLPDLFELRLDALSPVTSRQEKIIGRLRAPLIITARDPREGGAGKLSIEDRRALLIRFLPSAEFIDVELQAVRAFKSLLGRARKRRVRLILSYHNFNATPTSRSLCAKAKRAKNLGADIFKVATRTETPAELARLIGFVTQNDIGLGLSAMGIGKLGTISRLLLASCGSVLNYGSIGKPLVEGQLPIDNLAAALRPRSRSISRKVKIDRPQHR